MINESNFTLIKRIIANVLFVSNGTDDVEIWMARCLHQYSLAKTHQAHQNFLASTDQILPNTDHILRRENKICEKPGPKLEKQFSASPENIEPEDSNITEFFKNFKLPPKEGIDRENN